MCANITHTTRFSRFIWGTQTAWALALWFSTKYICPYWVFNYQEPQLGTAAGLESLLAVGEEAVQA